MIHVISLAATVKKSFKSMTQVTKVPKLIEKLEVDPAVSGIDLVVLQEKDISGLAGKNLIAALASKKHPDVDVLIFYKKESPDVIASDTIKLVKWAKPNVETAKTEIQTILENRDSDLNAAVKPEREVIVEVEKPVEPVVEEPEETEEVEPEVIVEEPQEEEDEEPVASEVEEATEPSIEDRLLALANSADFTTVKELTTKDSVIRELMDQNFEYSSASEMLDMLDQKIMLVFQDMTLNGDEKFSRVRDICLERANFRGLKNSILAEKYLSVIQAVIEVSEETVDYKLSNIKLGLDKFAEKKVLYSETDKLNAMLNERLDIQLTLAELSKEFLVAYRTIDGTVGDFIEGILHEQPSNIPYVNEMLKDHKNLFTPDNTKAVFNKLTASLQAHRISASAIEDKIEVMVDRLFQLLELDNDIISYQQRIIELLKAQRVEDVVVIDNMIKRVTRLIVGTKESGKTATALCKARVRSRQANTILLTFSKECKLGTYGVETIPFSKFMEDSVEKDLAFVNYDGQLDSESIIELVRKLKMRLSFYKNIYFLVDIEDVELIKELVPSALTIDYVTNGSSRTMDTIQEISPLFKDLQIGHQITLIDPPLPANIMLSNMKMDPLTNRVNILPNIKYVRQCSLQKRDPSLSEEVQTVYREALR